MSKQMMASKLKQKQNRNVGIDILRVLMMLGIVMLHYMGHGGLLKKSEDGGHLLWLLESITYMSVNCFVLITGYFQSKSTFKLQKVFMLLIQVVCWSVITYVICVAYGTISFSIKDLLKAVFPFFFDGYWFMTVYIAIYIFSPFINKALNSLEKKQHAVLASCMVCIFAFPFLDGVLGVKHGYGLLWFATLYIIGAYLRMHGVPRVLKTSICVLIYSTCVFILWGSQVISLPGISIVASFAWAYASIPALLSAICLFVIFSRIRVNRAVGKIVYAISPLTLGVYLFHDSEFFRTTLWGWINDLIEPSFAIVHVWVVPLVSLAIFAFAALAEFLRMWIFKILRIENAVRFIIKSQYNDTTDKLTEEK